MRQGLANLLLHEEAQFAPFEMQRTLEPETTRTVTGRVLGCLCYRILRNTSGSGLYEARKGALSS